MKRIYTTFFLLLISGMIYAQDAQPTQSATPTYPNHEIYVGVGLLNDNQLFSMVGDFLGTVFTLGQAVQPNKYFVLTPSMGYKYWFNKRVGLGIHYAFDFNSVKVIHHPVEDYHNADTVIHKRYFHTFAVEFGINYIHKPAFQLYGNVGMGVTLIQFSNNNAETGLKQFPFFNMNVVPLGMRFGKNVGGFIEFGWGYKGFINAGLSVKL